MAMPGDAAEVRVEGRPVRFVFMNLEEDATRRESFLAEFPGPEWVRFPGCRGGLMWGEIARGLGWLGDIRSSYGGQRVRPQWGTIGCTLSHLFCLRMAAACGGIVLFPDDLRNRRGLDLVAAVREIIANRPPGCGWLKLKNAFPRYAPEMQAAGGWTFRRLAVADRDDFADKANLGSAGVIILREQAQAILANLPGITSRGIDFELRALADLVPGGCWQVMETGIEHERPAGVPLGGSTRKRLNGEG